MTEKKRLRVLFTGYRQAPATDGPAVWNVIAKQVAVPGDMTILHGGAKGIDMIADAIGRGFLHVPVEVYPADWETHGKKAGPIRNQQMLDVGLPDLVLAFPSTNPKFPSRGTQDMIAKAQKAGVRTVVTWLP